MNKKLSNILFYFFVFLFFGLWFVSCDLLTNTDSAEIVGKKRNSNYEKEILETGTKDRLWNIFVYMSADNNLESAALEDLYEMECSKLKTDEVSLFVLIDRSASYDTSDNNWSGTRLYKINSGRTENDKTLISEEIECPVLNLTVGGNTELDMSSGYVLSKSLNYVIEKFPADYYGLIMWGHGTGWRSEDDSFELYKGFAYDDSSKSYMTLKQLGSALKNALDNRKLSFIGFDTCFAGEIEIAYELRDVADYFVGSEGLVMASGWNYTNLLNLFQRCNEKNTENLCSCVVEQFRKQYGNTSRASIVAIKMSMINEYFQKIDDFFSCASKAIVSRDSQNNLLGILYSNKNSVVEKYTYGSEKSDVYLDLNSMIEAIDQYCNTQTTQIKNEINEVERKIVLESWASDRKEGGLGIYFSYITDNGLLSTVHPASYIKNKTYDQIDFVINSKGYVPSNNNEGSFMDLLFYKKF